MLSVPIDHWYVLVPSIGCHHWGWSSMHVTCGYGDFNAALSNMCHCFSLMMCLVVVLLCNASNFACFNQLQSSYWAGTDSQANSLTCMVRCPWIMNFLIDNKLNLFQHGFCHTHSCRTALSVMGHQWARSIDHGVSSRHLPRLCDSFWLSSSWETPPEIRPYWSEKRPAEPDQSILD